MISLTNIQIGFAGRQVLKGVDLNIREKERLAIVGPNGCGKSTLLRIIAGFERPDQGAVALPSRVSLGYLPQEADLDVEHSLRTELLGAFVQVRAAQADMKTLEHLMETTDPASAEYDGLVKRYGHAAAVVDHGEGYSLDSKVKRVAAGLGFKPRDMMRPCREFSGGWQMRILLAKLLLQDPDVLLLDEPTNHLDLESILWLEEWIRSCQRTVVMVSHERAFMDRLVERLVCLEMGRADVYRGGYSRYLEQSAAKREQHWKAYEQQKEEIAQHEAFIRKFRYNAARAALVQSRVKQLEKIEHIEPPFHPTAIHFNFPPAPPSHRDVVTMKNLGHTYDGRGYVFTNADHIITKGEKIGLVGVNGAGKSTLLKIMAGLLAPAQGQCTLGGRVEMSYFAQYDTSSLRSSQTLLSAIEAVAPIGEATRARDVLGAFLFRGDEVQKPLSALSGGERTRFRLAQMLFSPANLLLLDEPTNHLDVTSRSTVEEALRKYTGTLIVVSHDRVFMDRVTNRVIEIEDGNVIVYPGKYNDYLAHKEKMLAQQEGAAESPNGRSAAGAAGRAGASMPYPDRKGGVAAADVAREQRKLDREQQKAASRKVRALERKIESLEEEIAHEESRLAQLDQRMAECATDYERLAALAEDRRRIADQVRQSYAHWEALHQQLEEFQNVDA